MSTSKIELIKEIEYLTNYQQLGRNLIELSKEQKSDLLDLSKVCLGEIGIYVACLEMDRKAYEKSISEYRADKIRAIERARRVEAENEELRIKLNKFEKGKKLGL